LKLVELEAKLQKGRILKMGFNSRLKKQEIMPVEDMGLKSIENSLKNNEPYFVYVGNLNIEDREKYMESLQERIEDELNYDTRVLPSEDGTFYKIFSWGNY
jgi:hypothetical protein